MSMLISIIGTSLLADRLLGFILADWCPILIVACMVAFSKQFGTKNLWILSIGILLIGFMFGNLISYVYFPVSIFVGYVTSHRISFQTMLWSYFVGELIVTFILFPLLSINNPVFMFTGILRIVWFLSYIASIFVIAFFQGFASFLIVSKIIKR